MIGDVCLKFITHWKSYFTQILQPLIYVSNNLDMTSCKDSLLKPPNSVYGITHCNKSLFDKEIIIPYLHFSGIKLSSILPLLKQYLLKIENFKPIENKNDGTSIYLSPEKVESWSSFPINVRNRLEEFSLYESNFNTQKKTLKYENYSLEDILKAVLPKEKDGLSSFTKTGHIVHVNMREHLLPFKSVIGDVLYDKVPGCRTVVNKVNIIDNTYRNFQMEILKGVNDMIVKVKENSCQFEFDFSKVYWNSRLCTEHERIVKSIKPDDVLFDIFAGVGPFSIPAAKNKCYTFANDLNPESCKWLNHNSKLNKIDERFLKTFNKDGREFILKEIKEYLPIYLNKHNIHITMNLPALGPEFLSSFINLFEEGDLPEIINQPIIQVYCFSKGENSIAIARELVNKCMDADITEKIINIYKVRTVSSMKEMMRVSIKLDNDILTGKILSRNNKRTAEVDTATTNKKCCHGEEQTEKQ